MILRRPFRDLVRRQLDLFADEHADLLRRAEEAERSYDRAARDDAEEAYGDYEDLVDEVSAELEELRDRYAATVADDVADEYVREFNRWAARRWRRLARRLD